jgi:1-phosphofructokinase
LILASIHPATAMILTLTGNLLAERTFDYAAWEPGRTQRARAESFQVGGKGINVAKMLHRLGAPTTALCFAGGATGEECAAWLARQGWPTEIFRGAHHTRAGLVVRAPGRTETTFLGPDVASAPRALDACAGYLSAHRTPTNVLAFSGSFPGWDDPENSRLRAAIAAWALKAPLAADSHGPPLAWLVTQPVKLIKINRQEFDELAPPAPAADPADLAPRLRLACARWPVPAWIVTDGPRPVWFAGPEVPPTALTPPAVTEVSATGSGDVLFACVLHALFHEAATLAEAVAFALPRAAANSASPGIADFDLNQLPPGAA